MFHKNSRLIILAQILIALTGFVISERETIFSRAVARFDIKGQKSEIVFNELWIWRTWVHGSIGGVYCLNSTSGVLNSSSTNVRPLTANTCHLGIHVHVNPPVINIDCNDGMCISSADCNACGPHYNPTNRTHGDAHSAVRHVGDLGNAFVSNGRAALYLGNVDMPLSGANSVVGRCLVLHGHTDDLGLGGNSESLANGNSDGRIACARIEMA